MIKQILLKIHLFQQIILSLIIISYEMSFEKQVEIYTYTLTVLNLTLKVKFPCRIYLENQGKAITNEVQPTNNNKFIFNQEVTLKNQGEKEFIELVVQLITEKGAKYVGGVIKLVENELIGSQGECIAIPISKCLDAEASCEVRVDQVATSRVVRKGSPKRKPPLRSEYNPDVLYSSLKPKFHQEGETKSEYNFPLTNHNIKTRLDKSKDPMVQINSVKKGLRGNESVYIQREGVNHAGGTAMSSLEFQVYKEGYNKLKDKYRKQAEVSRAEMNKRVALETSENNLKLEAMRYKLKAEEFEKTLNEKTLKVKELSDTISALQKKELDSKYLKEEAQNKNYVIKSLEETIKALNRDNNQLKSLQNQRYQTEQQNIQSLKDQIDKLKKDFENKELQLTRDLKAKGDLIAKRDYELHNKSEELERAKCNVDDLDKSLSNKTFEWEKVLQSERNAAKARQEELREKIVAMQSEKSKLNERIGQLQHSLQEKKSEVSKLEYDRKVLTQNNDILIKENQQLKQIKEKFIELNREHKIALDEKAQLEKAKERQTKSRDLQIDQLNQRIRSFGESNKRTNKEMQEKLKANQLRLIESDSQNQSLKNQLQKAKRQFEAASKELTETKNFLKDSRAQIKVKDDKILSLTNEISNASNKSSQAEYSVKIETAKLKEELDKLTKSLEEQHLKNKNLSDFVSALQLSANKNKMEWQFRQQKALKELGYSKDKVASLETIKVDLEGQIANLVNINTNLKLSEKSLTEKIQKLQLDAIKSKEGSEKSKKEIKILEEKIVNAENNLKNKAKEIADMQLNKDKLEKKIGELEAEISGLKNELNKEVSEKQRHVKIGEILQADLLKAKEEQTNLSSIISNKETIESSLRQELKKEKQEYTKLDMKLNALKKQFQKFKDTLVDNLNTVFSSIPEGLNNQSKQARSMVTEKSTNAKENSDVLNLLISLGRQARGNAVRNIQSLKQAIRDNQKLNSDYSLSVNKRNTTQFQYKQSLTALQEEMDELLEEKSKEQNRYEEEIFLLEGRVKEKEVTINELTEQVEELDFLIRNTKTQLEICREEALRKDIAKSKLIEELRDQIEYIHSENTNLQKSIENYQQNLQGAEAEIENRREVNAKLNKDLTQAKETIQQLEDQVDSLKKQLKKANEKGEELNMNLSHKSQELRKCEESLQEEERKASELREFLKGLMKQKEEIIKNELQKSQRVLQLETTVEELRHQIQSLEENLSKTKTSEEEQRQMIKKLGKSLKEEETSKLQEKGKGNKLADRLRDKEKQLIAKDELIVKLQDKLKKESEKRVREIKELETQLDETHQKLLDAERSASETILTLENTNDKSVSENQKLTQSLVNTEESLFRERNRNQDLKERLENTEKELLESNQQIKELSARLQSANDELRSSQEETYKLQGRINLLEMKFEMKQNQNSDKLQNLNEDWSSKYYSMEEQYEQRLELAEKERDFLKEKLAESDKEVKKLTGDLKSQESNVSSLKKNFEEKVKLLEEDRLAVIAQKNTENQRLVDEVRASFDSLKIKESECRKLQNDCELAKASAAKLEAKWREGEEKIRNLNRTFQTQSQEFKRKQQSFKRLKETVASSAWKAQREVRRLVQSSTRQMVELTEEKNTIKVMQIGRTLETNLLSAIAVKLEEKQL